jgi:predicted alpha/beta-fold hydrolase
VRFVSVPLLQLIASDDFLVYHAFKGKLAYSLANPNVMIVESKCGGHLGWQESPPDRNVYGAASWADAATTDFIAAVLDSYKPRELKAIDLDSYFRTEKDRNLSSSNLRSRL